LLIVRQVHFFDDIFKTRGFFGLVEIYLIYQRVIFARIGSLYLSGDFHGIFHAPGGQLACVPVVVDVVLVLIRAGYAQHNILLLIVGPVDPLRPKTGDREQHFQSIIGQVSFVAGVANVIENSISDSAVAVDLLEGDLPFVMAFGAIHRNHRIQGRAITNGRSPSRRSTATALSLMLFSITFATPATKLTWPIMDWKCCSRSPVFGRSGSTGPTISSNMLCWA